jgi:hypothetical protein
MLCNQIVDPSYLPELAEVYCPGVLMGGLGVLREGMNYDLCLIQFTL